MDERRKARPTHKRDTRRLRRQRREDARWRRAVEGMDATEADAAKNFREHAKKGEADAQGPPF